jgi:hypothetical protein
MHTGAGRALPCTITSPVTSSVGAFPVSWQHDSFLRVASEKVQGGTPVTFFYDDGLLSSASVAGSSVELSRDAQSGWHRTLKVGNTTVSTFDHDDHGALSQQTMKQVRAFGVGVLLATQNPMGLDYRALSNAGA